MYSVDLAQITLDAFDERPGYTQASTLSNTASASAHHRRGSYYYKRHLSWVVDDTGRGCAFDKHLGKCESRW
jgi:hypothetical protein